MSYKLTDQEQKLKRIEWLKEHFQRSHEKKEYAIQRIDLLIIAISTSGIIFISQVWLFLNDKNCESYTSSLSTLLFGSMAFFTLAIIINFLSQLTGYLSNKHEKIWALCEYEKHVKNAGDDYMLGKKRRALCKSDFYSDWTEYLNSGSMLLMLLAMTLCVLIAYHIL